MSDQQQEPTIERHLLDRLKTIDSDIGFLKAVVTIYAVVSIGTLLYMCAMIARMLDVIYLVK